MTTSIDNPAQAVHAAWAEAGAPDLRAFLRGDDSAVRLAAVLAADAGERRERGLPVGLTLYLDEWPELKPGSAGVRGILVHELAQLLGGESPERAREELVRRYGHTFLNDVHFVMDMHAAFARTLHDGLSMFEPGEKLQHYTLKAYLGRGAFGEVWKAHDTQMGRYVALKLLPEGENPALRWKSLSDEAKATAAVNHDNVVAVWHTGRVDSGWFYIAMELCGDAAPTPDDPLEVRVGESLAELVSKTGGKLPPRRAAELMAEAAKGVAAAHARGVVHRDIKPGNILVTPSGRAMVADFGLATPALLATESQGERLSGPIIETVTLRLGGRVVCGAPPYMSPEQARGERALPLSDVYGLGATLQFLLSGEHPFGPSDRASGDARHDIVRQVADPLCSPRELSPAIPGTLIRICRRAMHKDADKRFESASSFAADLDAWLGHRVPPTVRARAWWEVPALWCRRWRLLVGVGTIAAAGVMASTAWYIQSVRAERTVSEREQKRKAKAVEFLQGMFFTARPDQSGGSAMHKDVVLEAARGVEDTFQDDPETAASVLEQAGTTLLSYRDPAAIEVYSRCAELRERLLGPSHADTLDTRVLQAIALREAERLDEAQEVIDGTIRLRAPGAGQFTENALAARVTANSIRLVRFLNTSDQALLAPGLQEAQAVVQDAATHLGADNPHTLSAQYTHARWNEEIGNLREAEDVLRRVVDGTHEDPAAGGQALDALGRVLQKLGRFEEAAELYQQSLTFKMQAFSPFVRDTLLVDARIACLLVLRGQTDKGIERLAANLASAMEHLDRGDWYFKDVRAAVRPLLDLSLDAEHRDRLVQLLEGIP